MKDRNKSQIRYATYCWTWTKPFSLTTHGTQQHYSRRNLKRIEAYCMKNEINPVLKFTDHVPENLRIDRQLPGLIEAMHSAVKDEYDVLIITRRSEICWNMKSLISTVGGFLQNNVTIECITEPFTHYFNNERLIVLPLEPDDPNLRRYGNTT